MSLIVKIIDGIDQIRHIGFISESELYENACLLGFGESVPEFVIKKIRDELKDMENIEYAVPDVKLALY